jgi:putative ABC transport system permease protein
MAGRDLFGFARRRRALTALDREIQNHIQQDTQDNIDRGLSPAEAHRQALLKFGNVARIREDTHDVWVWTWLRDALQDLRCALRMLRRNPGFASVSILTLVLGIGANIAIFAVVHAALLKPLSYPNPDRVVAVSTYIPELSTRFPSLAVRAIDFEAFREGNRAFSALAAVRERNFSLTGHGEAERLYGARVSANLFSVLGVHPEIGRSFLSEEDVAGRDRVVIISHGLFTRRFGADPGILNQTILLDGQPHLVVGVMPRDFLFPAGKQLQPQVELGPRIDVWTPAAFTDDDLADELTGFSWGVIGRLNAGVAPQAAQANLDDVARAIASRLRGRVSGVDELRTRVTPIREIYFGNVRRELLMLMGTVGLILAIACVNLVNLLLARQSSRSRELATRTSLGAPRGRLVRQLLTESLVLAALGGVIALPIAVWGARVIVRFGPSELQAAQTTGFESSVLLFAVTVILATGMAVGIVPALEMARGKLQGDLSDGNRGTTPGRRSGNVRRALVMSEVALCTALLMVSALLLRSFVNLLDVDRGFQTAHSLSLDVALAPERYQGLQRVAFFEQLLESVRALPDVASAGGISVLPLASESEGNTMLVYRDTDTEARLDRPAAQYRVVTDGYFAAADVPVVAGRPLGAGDPASHVVASQGLVERLWAGEPASATVGRRIKIQEIADDPVTIVGVVGDVRAAGLDREPTPTIYVPHARNRMRTMTILVRSTQPPDVLTAAIRAEIGRLDDSVPIDRVRTMEDVVSQSLAPRRFQAFLVLLFAPVALSLALVGIYGVASYMVARETREIGIRLALGAQRNEVLRSVLMQGVRPVVAGIVCGAALAWMMATAVRSALYGVTPLDPVVLGTVPVALIATGTIACLVPALRASRIDPVMAMRAE